MILISRNKCDICHRKKNMHRSRPARRAELAFREAARDVAIGRHNAEMFGAGALDVGAALELHGLALQALQEQGTNSRAQLTRIVMDQAARVEAVFGGDLGPDLAV